MSTARDEPPARRPHMPGYGIVAATDGAGLLPWDWAETRLRDSHDYWVATVWPDGRPHVMPVWAVWFDRALWFSSSGGSRKTRNVEQDARCTVTTQNPLEPVVVEGRAERRRDDASLHAFLDAVNGKYGTSYGDELIDPATNATFCVTPTWVFGLRADDFTGTPTRWSFEPANA
jgi:PPOX class probable F420-dependent enzyme